jgi:hypothetical protein
MIEVMTQLPPPLISIDCDQLMYQDDPMLTCLNDTTLSSSSSFSSSWNNNISSSSSNNGFTFERFAPADEWLSDLYYNPGCPSFTSSPG